MLAAVTMSSGMFLPAGPPSYFCSTALELAYDVSDSNLREFSGVPMHQLCVWHHTLQREYRGKLEGLPRLPTLYHFAPLR